VVLGLALVGSVLLGLVLQQFHIPYGNYDVKEFGFSKKTLRFVEECIGIQLPEGSKGKNMAYRGARDPLFAAKIEIRSSSLDSFVRLVEEKPTRLQRGIESDLFSHPWWRSEDADEVVYRRYHHEGFGVEVSVCKEDGAWYLYAFCMTF